MDNSVEMKTITPREADLVSWFMNEVNRLGNPAETIELACHQANGIEVNIVQDGQSNTDDQMLNGKTLTIFEINMSTWFFNQKNNLEYQSGKKIDLFVMTYNRSLNNVGIALQYVEQPDDPNMIEA